MGVNQKSNFFEDIKRINEIVYNGKSVYQVRYLDKIIFQHHDDSADIPRVNK